jgi:ubiquinone/menaquinone biosynthesis C-methylase UbiE
MPIKARLKQGIKKIVSSLQPPAKPHDPTAAPHSAADVAEHYDKYIGDYEATYGPILQAGRPFNIEDLLHHEMNSAKLEDGQHVLDAGCGVCGPSIWFAQHKQVTIDAVTISTAQREVGIEAVKKAGLSDRIHVQLADYHKLEETFPTPRFDRILFLESIIHAESYRRALESSWKVLKPGGCVYIKDYSKRYFPHDPPKQARADAFLKKLHGEYAVTVMHKFELGALFEDLGYQVEFLALLPFAGENEDLSIQLGFEQRVGFHWRDGLDFWLPESIEIRARKPA